MVEMAVGGEDGKVKASPRPLPKGKGGKVIQQLLLLVGIETSGIDEEHVALLVGNDVGIGAKRAECEGFQFHLVTIYSIPDRFGVARGGQRGGRC